MRIRTSPGTNRHQIVLSLTPERLQLLHLQRGVLGWRRAHEEQRPLPPGDAFLSSVQEQLQQCVQAWRLPPATRAHWVLAGDILGIVAPAPAGTPAAALLPFAPNDVRLQPELFARNAQPGMLWIHKDWLAEIERISAQCGLELVELYARAQLFQRAAARAPGACKVVVEQLQGEQPQSFLHVYAAGGTLARTRVLAAGEQGDALPGLVAAELAALGAGAGAAAPHALLMAQRPAQDWPGLRWQALKATGEAERLWQLWRSDLEGITVRSTHQELAGTIKALSVGLGLAGAAALGAMVWHDGRLQQQIDEDSAAVRRDAPRVAAARALKDRTLQMADADQAARALQEGDVALSGLAQIATRFPPPPATLLYLRSDARELAFAGAGDEASVQALRALELPGYGPLQDWPVPDVMAQAQPAIHLRAERRAPQPAAAAAAAAPETPSSAPAPRESGT